MVAPISGTRLNHNPAGSVGERAARTNATPATRSNEAFTLLSVQGGADKTASTGNEMVALSSRAPGALSQLRPANSSTPLPTNSYSSTTREYTPAENQIRAVNRRTARLANEAAHQLAHDTRVAAQQARRAAAAEASPLSSESSRVRAPR